MTNEKITLAQLESFKAGCHLSGARSSHLITGVAIRNVEVDRPVHLSGELFGQVTVFIYNLDWVDTQLR